MIKTNIEKAESFFKLENGKILKFDTFLFLKAIKFLMKKYNKNYGSVQSQLIWLLTNNYVNGLNISKKWNNAQLKNIVNLDYDWEDLF